MHKYVVPESIRARVIKLQGKPFALERREHAAHLGVDLADEIRVGIEPAGPLEFLGRNDRRVRGVERDIQEERLLHGRRGGFRRGRSPIVVPSVAT